MTTANTEPQRKDSARGGASEDRRSGAARAAQPWTARLRRQMAIVTRWLHIYLSMVSFAVVLFFAVTGLTLNHAEALSHGEKVTELHGTLSAAEMGSKESPDRLAIVEHIRNTDHVHGAVADFRAEDGQVTFSFRAPGYSADTTLDQGTGKYTVVETRNGFVAVINDLHKGRDSGKAWSLVIDVSAVLLTLVSISGLVLIFFVYKRRLSGLILAAAGGACCVLLYRLFVP